MLGLAQGIFAIASLVFAGYSSATLKTLGPRVGDALVRTSYFLATPALIFLVISRSDWHVILTAPMVIAISSAVGAAGVALILILFFARRSPAINTITVASAIYLNSTNVGIPLATFVLQDPTAIAAILLVQPLLFTPLVVGLVEYFSRGKTTFLKTVTRSLRNPILAAAIMGLGVSVSGIRPPAILLAPIEIIAGAAIPLVLIAFGIALRGQTLLAPGSDQRPVGIAVFAKNVVMPLVAWIVAGPMLNLSPTLVYASVMFAALPTGQIVFTYASRFDVEPLIARDTFLVSSLVSVPMMFVVTLFLNP